jgi:hypothetical protein
MSLVSPEEIIQIKIQQHEEWEKIEDAKIKKDKDKEYKDIKKKDK